MPQWLAEYNGNGIDLGGVRKTASVYYPGAGFDGQPIHTFNAGHAAYLYIYADYGVEKQVIESKLDSFKGYKVIGKEEIAKNSGVYPERLLVGTNCTEPWNGFGPANSPGVLGGMYSEPRQLFCRSCWR